MRTDAVVIGGGHNGLVCANYLIRAGLDVTLVEAQPTLGGAARRLNWSGVETTFGATWAGMLRPEIIHDLNLQDHGLMSDILDPQIFAHDYDGRMIGLFFDVDKTSKSLRGVTNQPMAAIEAIHAFEDAMARGAELFGKLFLLPSPTDRARAYHDADPTTKELFELSIQGVLSSYQIPEPLASAIAAGALSLTNSQPDECATAFALVYMATAQTNGVVGAWARPRDSMAVTIEALAKVFDERGGNLVTADPVVEILSSRGSVHGVQLRSGTNVASKLVVSCVHPAEMIRLLPESADWFGAPAPELWRGLSATVRMTVSSEVIASDLPPGITWSKLDRALFVATPGSMNGLGRARKDLDHGKDISEKPLTTYSMKVLPTDDVLIEAYVQFVSYACPQQVLVNATIQSIQSLFPRLADGIHDFIGFPPSELDKLLRLPGGHPEHLQMQFPNLLEDRPSRLLASYTTPLGGLFAGAAAWFPGGTVSGVPGRNCAQVALAWCATQIPSS